LAVATWKDCASKYRSGKEGGMKSTGDHDPRSLIYQHVKTGGLYQVIEWHAKHEATTDEVVVYRNLASGLVWVRPYSEFLDGRFKCLTKDEVGKLAERRT
jgi:hypothetical protein